MALASTVATTQKMRSLPQACCRKKERDRDHHNYPFRVVEITPPPRNLGVRRLPSNIHCGESVTIEGQPYTVSAVIHRYQLRRGKYEPRESRVDVQLTGRYILNLYLENLLEQS
ncbi:uncharacterized protein LOC110023555 [Phalaenopsis equestris]|uniref:uncharacterized protein LOC110023555 n=1 Tax=Phalaenopsis equestris TaxID=78828 RepID=UPI0009E53B71|nr:uncharacterized protein LOC110023555 [Phalaenopsis equestris]